MHALESATRVFSLGILGWIAGVLLLSSDPGRADTLVRLADGSAAAYAEITAWDCAPTEAMRLLEGPIWRGRADAKGRLREELPVDGCVLLVADVPEAPPQVLRLEHEIRKPLALSPGIAKRAFVETAQPVAAGELCVDGELKLESIQRTYPWRRCFPVSLRGEVALSGLPSGDLHFELRIPEYLTLSGTASTEREWRLHPRVGTLVAGRIVDPAGGAIAGASVSSLGAVEARSDKQGRFRIAIAGPPADLRVSAPGFAEQTLHLVKVPSEAELTLHLDRGMWVEAAVAGDATDVPLRATVTLERRVRRGGWSGEDYPVDDQRSVRIPVQLPGKYRLRVRAAGYRVAWVDPFEVIPATTVRLGTIELDHGIVVRGRFVLEDNLPVRGVRVRIEPQGAALLGNLEVGFLTTVSGGDGRFELLGLTSGTYDMRARHARAGMLTRRLELSGDRGIDLGDLVLDAPVTVHGLVVNRGGEPRGGLSVELFDERDARLLPLDRWVSDDRGRFDASIAPGRYTVRVESDHVLLSQAVDVERDTPDLKLIVPGVAVHGLVVREGEPLAGGTIVLVEPIDPGLRSGVIDLRGAGEQRLLGGPTSRQMTAVDVRGRFDLSDVAPGLQRFTYVAVDGRRWTRDEAIVDQADQALELDLSGVTLHGFVHRRDSDVPVASAEIRLVADLGDVVSEARSGDDGEFAVPDLQPAFYTLTVSAAGFAAKTIPRVRIEPGMPTIDCALERGERGNLSLHLTRPDGSPASFDFLTLVSPAGTKLRSAPTDATGRLVFEDLPSGTYFAIWADPISGVGVSRALTIAPEGNDTELDQPLPGGVTVTLACAICGSRPVGSLFVSSQGLLLNGGLPELAGGRVFPPDGLLAVGRVSAGATYSVVWNDGTRSVQKNFIADRESIVVQVP